MCLSFMFHGEVRWLLGQEVFLEVNAGLAWLSIGVAIGNLLSKPALAGKSLECHCLCPAGRR